MPKTPGSATREGPQLLSTLWRYRWMTLLIVLASIAVGYTLSTQFAGEPTATARMVLADPRGNTVLRQGVTSEATFIRYLEQRADLARSEPVLSRVSEALEVTDADLDVTELRSRVVTSGENSGEVVVAASGSRPDQAAAIANAVIEAYRDQALMEHTDQRDVTIAAVEAARRQIVDRGDEEGAQRGPGTEEALAQLEIRIADILVDTSTFDDGILFSEPAVATAASTTLSPVRSALVGGLLGLVLALAIGLVRNELSGAARLAKHAARDTTSEHLPDWFVGARDDR